MELTLVILVRCSLDNFHQTVEALENYLMRRRIVNLGGRSAGALGIDKRIGLSITDRLGKRKRLLKVFLGLAGEAHDDISRKRDIGHAIADAIDEPQIILARIASIHLFKDARRARLNCQVQLRHDGRRLGHSVDGLGQKVFRVRGSKEDTLYTRIAHGTQQVGKARLAKQIATIGVDVLPQKRDLTHALA